MRLPISSQKRLHRRSPRECFYRPNARFWSWWTGAGDPDAYVKITLRPGQRLRWAHGGCTDEGYASLFITIEHEENTHANEVGCENMRLFGTVFYECDREERDCDGRHDWQSLHACPVDKLAVDFVDGRDFGAARTYLLPEWTKVSARQRDQFAELAGY